MNSNLPEISRITEFQYNDAIQVYGEGISPELIDNNSGLYLWQPKGKPVPTADFPSKLPEAPHKDSVKLKFGEVFNQVGYVAPCKQVKSGVGIAWLENKNGISEPFVVNNPRIFNQSAIRAIAGDVVRFAGISMLAGYDNAPFKRQMATLMLRNDENGEAFFVENSSDKSYVYNKEDYLVEFIIPEGIPAGHYKAYLHNGSGGEYGWSDETDLEIYEKQSLIEYYAGKCSDTVSRQRIAPICEMVTVRPNENGMDMADAIQAAVDSFKNGGIVQLVSGIYSVGHSIILKNGVVLKGAGKNNTVIRTFEGSAFKDDWSQVVFAQRANGMQRWANDWRSHFEPENPQAILRLTENCGVMDLRLEFGNGANIGIMVANLGKAQSDNVFINQVSVDNGYKNALNGGDIYADVCTALMSVVSTNDLTVYNSSLKGITPIELLPARNRRLKHINNHIECSPAQIGESFVCGIVDSQIIGNTFMGGRRSLLIQDGCNNNLIYQNRSIGVSRSGNAEEQYMSEFGIPVWHGTAKCADGYIELSSDDIMAVESLETVNQRLDEYNLYLCILDGKGFGQYRRIIKGEGNRLYIDKPWAVIPDEKTLFTMVAATTNNIYLNNNSENGNGPTNIVWGCGIENVVIGHEVVHSYAICLHGLSVAGPDKRENALQKCRLGVVAFNRLIGCQFKSSGMGIRTDSSAPNRAAADENFERQMRHHGLFGTVIKNNAVEGNKSACYLKNQTAWIEESYNSGLELGGAYNLVENNLVSGFANAVKLRYDCEGNYFAKNAFLYCDNKFVFEPRHNNYGYFDNRTTGPDADKLWFN